MQGGFLLGLGRLHGELRGNRVGIGGQGGDGFDHHWFRSRRRREQDQRAMLTGDANKNRYPQPPQEETEFDWVPRVDGIARGTGANVRVYRVNFTYSEILPLYPSPS